MRRTFLALTALTTVTLAACAIAYEAPSKSLVGAPSGNYEIDASHTSVQFGISHMGFSSYQGRFNTVGGKLAFDAKDPTKSKLEVTIDTASIDTNNAKLEGELKGDKWFDATKFPKVTFVSTSIQKLTDTTGKVTGDLTLHGVTKPVTLDVTFNGAGNNPLANVAELGFGATGTIKRSDFGVKEYIPMVGDDVAIAIQTEMHLKQ